MRAYHFKVHQLMLDRGLSYSEACAELDRQYASKQRSQCDREHSLWRRINAISPAVQALPRIVPHNP